MNSFSQLIDEVESEKILRTRETAQTQFVNLSTRYVELSEELLTAALDSLQLDPEEWVKALGAAQKRLLDTE